MAIRSVKSASSLLHSIKDDSTASAAPRPLDIAVIGEGYWGKKVIREVLEIGRTSGLVTLHSVTDDSPIFLDECAKEFGQLDYRLDYKSLLSDPRPDAVYIASRNSSHYEMASALIQSGKSVLVEKPLALTSRDAYDLLDLSRRNDVVLSVGHIHRFNSAVRALRRAIASGTLGDIHYVRIRWTALLSPQLSGDVITDLSPHPFDISNSLLGTWPKTITCRGNFHRTRKDVEVAFIAAEYADGLSVNIEVSWLDREKHREVTVVGSKGNATIDCSQQTGVIMSSDRIEPVPIAPANSLMRQIQHFVDCVTNKSLSRPFVNVCPGTLGVTVARLQEAAMRSLNEGKTISVESEPDNSQTVSEAIGATVESVLDQLGKSNPNYFWDPDALDPDYSVPSNIIDSTVEARIRASRHRTNILWALNSSNMTPSELASTVGLDLSNLGKYVNELMYNGLVDRKTAINVRKGRIYGLTKNGRKLSEMLVRGQSHGTLEREVEVDAD